MFRTSILTNFSPGRTYAGTTFLIVTAMLLLSCTPEGASEADATPLTTDVITSQPREVLVRPGIEVLLSDSIHLVAGLRVGFVTNHTSLDRNGASAIDVLHAHPEVRLTALFGPEHGLRGGAEAGERVEDGRDPATGLPVYSLYSSTLSPPPEAIADLDVLLFDIQDIGARYYTYVSTMALSMEAAGAAGIPFVVLDRPNPIGGTLVQGNTLLPDFSSFVGMYPVPMRHGMTPGELARMYVGEFGVEVDLHVVPAAGWLREMPFSTTGLPWVAPSPNMPTIESALHYPGTCLFEGTNLSVGRGTDRPFQWIGAPWLDGQALAAQLNGYGIEGVRFEGATFTPSSPGDGKFDGEEVSGVRFVVTDETTYDPTLAAVAALLEARVMSGGRWQWMESHFDRLAGTATLRAAIQSGAAFGDIVDGWWRLNQAFEQRRAPYLIYPRAF